MWLLAQDGLPLVFVVATVGLIAGVSLSFAFLPLRVPPTDRQIARFIEEQAGGLDEVVVTAVDKSQAATSPVVEMLVADAIRAARGVDPSRVVTADSMRSAAIGGRDRQRGIRSGVLFLRAGGRARRRCRRLVPVPELLRDRSDAGIDQGA